MPFLRTHFSTVLALVSLTSIALAPLTTPDTTGSLVPVAALRADFDGDGAEELAVVARAGSRGRSPWWPWRASCWCSW